MNNGGEIRGNDMKQQLALFLQEVLQSYKDTFMFMRNPFEAIRKNVGGWLVLVCMWIFFAIYGGLFIFLLPLPLHPDLPRSLMILEIGFSGIIGILIGQFVCCIIGKAVGIFLQRVVIEKWIGPTEFDS